MQRIEGPQIRFYWQGFLKGIYPGLRTKNGGGGGGYPPFNHRVLEDSSFWKPLLLLERGYLNVPRLTLKRTVLQTSQRTAVFAAWFLAV